MTLLFSKRLVGFVALCAVAILGLLAAQFVLSKNSEPVTGVQNSGREPVGSVALMPGRPRSLKEFVNRSEVIVIGRISRFTKEGFEGPYAISAESGPNEPKMPEHPFSYFDLEVIEVISNPREIPLDGPLSLRHGGLYSTRNEIEYDPPFYEIGDQNLYGLTINPDGTYGSWGSWWAVIVQNLGMDNQPLQGFWLSR